MRRHLPRLPEEFYRGRTGVFWTHTTVDRRIFLDGDLTHQRFREILCHAGCRYKVMTPVYTLMPDHFHLLWLGWSEDSHQLRANRFLRRNLAAQFPDIPWQRQAHDHVLREGEMEKNALLKIMTYIRENPVRGGFVQAWKDFPYTGAMVPGYPDLDPRNDDFPDKFWRIYGILAGGY